MIGKRIRQIAKSKGVPVNLIAEKLEITPQYLYSLFKKDSIETRYLFQFAEILDVSPDVLLMGESAENLSTRATSELLNEITILKNRISELEEQLADKNQVLDFVRRENLFAYANLISALVQNRTSGGNMSPDQLSDMAKSRIFDPVFLRKLLDQGLISEADYQFFTSSITKKK